MNSVNDMDVNATIDNLPEKDKDGTDPKSLVGSKPIPAIKRVQVNIRCRPSLPSDTGT